MDKNLLIHDHDNPQTASGWQGNFQGEYKDVHQQDFIIEGFREVNVDQSHRVE